MTNLLKYKVIAVKQTINQALMKLLDFLIFRPFTAATGVRLPLGTPLLEKPLGLIALGLHYR